MKIGEGGENHRYGRIRRSVEERAGRSDRWGGGAGETSRARLMISTRWAIANSKKKSDRAITSKKVN